MTITEEMLECTGCDWVGFEEQAKDRWSEQEGTEYDCPACGEICAHFPLDEIGNVIETNISHGWTMQIRAPQAKEK